MRTRRLLWFGVLALWFTSCGLADEESRDGAQEDDQNQSCSSTECDEVDDDGLKTPVDLDWWRDGFHPRIDDRKDDDSEDSSGTDGGNSTQEDHPSNGDEASNDDDSDESSPPDEEPVEEDDEPDETDASQPDGGSDDADGDDSDWSGDSDDGDDSDWSGGDDDDGQNSDDSGWSGGDDDDGQNSDDSGWSGGDDDDGQDWDGGGDDSTDTTTDDDPDFDLQCADDPSICRFCGPVDDLVTECPAGDPSFECQVFELINEIRVDEGLDTLEYDGTLAEAAMIHAMDLSLCDYFGHDSLDGTDFFERCYDTGYGGTCTGENIGGGQQTPQAVVDAWMDSPGHRQNILYPHHSELGIAFYEGDGFYTRYWVKNFGRR